MNYYNDNDPSAAEFVRAYMDIDRGLSV